MKKFLLLGCFLLALMLLVPAVALASYDYYIPIEIYNNNSTSVTGLPVLVTLNNSQLASLGYILASGLDTDVQEGSSSREYTVADARLGLFLPFIDAYQSRTVNYRLGQSPAQSNFSVVLGSGGYFNITDHNNLELGNNFSIEFEGYINTSQVSEKVYPTVVANTSSSVTSATNHTVSLPSGIQVGELLFVFWSSAKSGTVPHGVSSWPTGWTQLVYVLGQRETIGVIYKIATGTEGSSCYVTTNISAGSSHMSYRIIDFQGTPEAGSTAFSITTNPDPPSLAPSWGNTTTLWIAGEGKGIPSVYPTNYTSGHYKSESSEYSCIATARRNLEVSSENPGNFTCGSTWAAAFTVAIQGISKGPVYKKGAFSIYTTTVGTLSAGIFGGSSKNATATGISSGGYLVEVWANVTYFGINIDGITQNMTALSGAVVTNNTEPWQVSVPYFEHYEHYTNTTLRVRYLPITMISGTTLVDRTGNGHTGNITWGTNPDSIELSIGGLQPFSSYVAPGSEDDEVPDILPVPGSITPDATSGATGQGLPLQAAFQATADGYGWTLPTTYTVMFMIVALVMGVAGLAIGSTWGFTIGFGSTSAFFGAVRDSGGYLVMPIWITVVMVMIALFIGFVWRTH